MTSTIIDGTACRQCGTRLEDAEAFCSGCGAPRAIAVGQDAPPAPHAVPPAPAVAPESRAAERTGQDWSRRWPVEHPELPVYTSPEQAALTTVVGGMLALGALVGVANLWGGIFPDPSGGGSTSDPRAMTLGWWFVPLAPLAMLGAYGLSLLRLRRVGLVRAAPEVLGLSLVAVLGLPTLLLAGGDALHALGLLTTRPDDFGTMEHAGPFGTWIYAAGEYLTGLGSVLPRVVLWAALTAAIISVLALGCASGFAQWDDVRRGPRPPARWSDGLLLVGSLLGVAVLVGLAALWVQVGWLLLWVLVAVLAAMPALTAWRTYRTLQPAIREHRLVYVDDRACVVQTTYVDGHGVYGAYRLDADGRVVRFVAHGASEAEALAALGVSPR